MVRSQRVQREEVNEGEAFEDQTAEKADDDQSAWFLFCASSS
jgi:hypothetical protein